MLSAKTHGVDVLVLASCMALVGATAQAQDASPPASSLPPEAGRGMLMVRLQLEPGALLARQNGPLSMAVNSLGLSGSLAIGVNVSSSTAVGAEAWVGLAALPSMTITPPAFDGAGDTVDVEGPTLMALLAGPHITHVFEQERFSVSATAGVAIGQFDYKSYDLYKSDGMTPTLPYNRSPDLNNGMPTAIPLDKTSLGWGFGVSLSKLWPLADAVYVGVGAHFRYLLVPDDAIYYDDDARGMLRYRADSWSITSFGATASLTYF